MADRDDYAPGDVVSVRFGGVLRHYGVVTMRGTVIANSRLRGGVVETSLEVFADGRRVPRHRHRGGDLDRSVIEARARRLIGADYRLTSSNCIDLTRYTHRRTPTPWQMGAATLSAAADLWRNSRRR